MSVYTLIYTVRRHGDSFIENEIFILKCSIQALFSPHYLTMPILRVTSAGNKQNPGASL